MLWTRRRPCCCKSYHLRYTYIRYIYLIQIKYNGEYLFLELYKSLPLGRPESIVVFNIY